MRIASLFLFLLCLFLLAGCNEIFDHFSTDGFLDPSYRWFDNPPPDSYEVSGGMLHITANAGQDLWGGVPLKRGAPIMLHNTPPGDYEVECMLDSWHGGAMKQNNTQVGLFVFKDVENWLFFGFTKHSNQGGSLPAGDGLIVTSTINDESQIVEYQAQPRDDASFKIAKNGNDFRFYVKLLYVWEQVGPVVTANLGTHEVGMAVKSFQDGGSVQEGHFDEFKVTDL